VKQIALGALLALVAAIPARAADIPAPMVTKAPVVVLYNWSGFYIGGNLGYSWGRSNTDLAASSTTGTVYGSVSDTVNLNGWVAGGQIGVNWQTGNTVWGLEGDIQATGQKGGGTVNCPLCGFVDIFVIPPFAVNVPVAFDQKLTWLATLRARLGWTFTPTTLLYITGGAAFGEIKTDFTATGPTVTSSGSTSNTKVGWTIGGGLEAALGNSNWTGKVEYLYVDLGTVSGSVTTNIPAFPTGFLVLGSSSRITDHIFRVGLNYRFGR
jgi:outer membrane immunogenic protein